MKVVIVTCCWLCALLNGQDLARSVQRFDRASKYYRITSFSVGRLNFTGVGVSLVAVSPNIDAAGQESVPVLQIARAHISYRDRNQAELLSGDLDDGINTDPALELSGRFQWVDGKPKPVEIRNLRIRLKRVHLNVQIADTKLTIPTVNTVFVSSRSPLGAEPVSGILELAFRGASLLNTKTEFAGTVLTANFRSSALSTAALNLGDDILRLQDGTFIANQVSAAIAKPFTTLFPDLTITSGQILSRQLHLNISGENGVLWGDLSVDGPQIRLQKYPDIEVVAAASVVAPIVRTEIRVVPGILAVSTLTGDCLVKGDTEKIIDEINLYSHFRPDVFLPTGAKDIRFAKASAVATMYGAITRAKEKRDELQILTISGVNHVITGIEASVGHDPITTLDATVLPLLCGVSVDSYVGEKAIATVNNLLNVAYQTTGAPTTSEYSRVLLRLSPKYGSAIAVGIVRGANFLTDTETGVIAGPQGTTSTASGSRRLTADVILGGPPNSPVVKGSRNTQSLLLASVESTPGRWRSPENRYRTLVFSEQEPGIPAPEVTGIIKTPPTFIGDRVLRGRPGQFGDPRLPPHKPHEGVDLVANQTSMDKKAYSVRAVRDGKVAYARWNGADCNPSGDPTCDPSANGYGYTVVIDHGDGTYTLYAHLATVASSGVVKFGEPVKAGQVIGYMADPAHKEMSSGNARDARYVVPSDRIQLHFEEFEAPPGRNSTDALSKIKGGARMLDPTPDLVATGYKPSRTGSVPLTHDQSGRLLIVETRMHARDAMVAESTGERSAVAALRSQQIQVRRGAATQALQRRNQFQQQLESYNRTVVEPATNQQKQAYEQQRQMNQGGGYVGGISPPGPTPAPIPPGIGSPGSSSSGYCGTSTDGVRMQLCTQIRR